MRNIQLLQPAKISFGRGCASECCADLADAGCRRAFLISSPQTARFAHRLAPEFEASGIAQELYDGITGEPTVADLHAVLARADSFAPDAVVGIGGGSVLDAAKLVAALAGTGEDVAAFFGIGLLKHRRARLACLPTTAGTGSEVSPNAILLAGNGSKQGVISRCRPVSPPRPDWMPWRTAWRRTPTGSPIPRWICMLSKECA